MAEFRRSVQALNSDIAAAKDHVSALESQREELRGLLEDTVQVVDGEPPPASASTKA